MCQRWRFIIFASAPYLDLKVFCTYGTRFEEILSFPLGILTIMKFGELPGSRLLTAVDEDGIVTFLGDHSTRIFEIQLPATAPLLKKMAILTQQPFSMLERLYLSAQTVSALVLPRVFGGAPRLRILRMVRIALPAMPKLLLLAQDLVFLQLDELSNIGYTLEALLICLPVTTQLKTLRIHFHSPCSRPVLTNTLQSPERHSVLPCLNYIEFHGTSESLESLLSIISTPFLNYIHITFFNQLGFHIPQLSQFILRTETQRTPKQATIHYSAADISITLSQPGMPYHFALRVLCKNSDWQISSMAELCEGLSPTLSHVERLNIGASTFSLGGQDDTDLTQLDFLDLFRQFIHVRRLCVTGESVLHVAGALRPITGQLAVTVLPELEEIYVGKRVELAFAQNGLAPFIDARERSAHPIVILSLEPEPTQNFHSHADLGLTAPTGIKPHLLSVRSLFQLGPCDLPPFPQNDAKEIENFPWVPRDLLDLHPNPMSAANLIQKLESSPAYKSQVPEDIAKSGSIPVRYGIVAVYESLDIEWRRASFSRMWAHSSTAVAYQNALSALQSVLVARPTTRLLFPFFERLGPRLHIPLEYASYLIERGQLELAVETIEQGKALIWSEMFGLHSPMGKLRRIDPDLADRLAHFTQALQAINNLISVDQRDANTFNLVIEELKGLLNGRQEVIQRIRALQGFANFMKAVPFRTLQTAAARGPVIMINHCHWRCDILIVLHDSPPSLIPTNEGFYERANNLERELKDARRRHRVDLQEYIAVLIYVLEELYELVGRPVIDRLRELGIPEQSRIWWYPTSVFNTLPFHAMGPLPSTDGSVRYFFDIYVCSYTPTLGSLIQSRGFLAPKTHSQNSLLLVAEPEPNFPTSHEEVEVLQSLPIPVTTLISKQATPWAVIDNLRNHNLVHFAYHGTLEAGDPLNVAIECYGHDRLTVRDIANGRLPPAEFAFLSASNTAGPTDLDDPTEGLNIAAAMQYLGCGSVVGTMWAMVNEDGGDLSRQFYKALFAKSRRDHDVPLAERSARALQFAVKKLRRKRGTTLERWVNWVHYGA